MIVTATPSEVEFLYRTCCALVAAEASWCAILPSISSILCRRFTDSLARPSKEDVVSAVLDVVAAPGFSENPERIMKLTAIVKYHAHCLTLDHWNDVFIQMENALKALHSTARFDQQVSKDF